MLTTWSCLREGIDAFVRRFPLFMGAWLVILAVQQLIDVLIPDLYAWAEIPAVIVLLAPLYAGQYLLALKVVQNEPVSFREFFRGFSQWGTLIGVSLLTSVVVAVGFFLLVVPGIVWALTFAFAAIVVLDPWSHDSLPRKVGILDAMQRSKELTKGYRGVLFGVSFILGLPTIAIAVLASIKAYVPEFPLPLWAIEVLALLSGALFLGPVGATSYMVAYDAITKLERSTYDDAERVQGVDPISTDSLTSDSPLG